MKKIQMQTPLVEMDGDEMTRILWKIIKDELLLPYIDLNTEYYDLGLEYRNETDDQVTVDAAEATKKYGVAVKCATITPNKARMEEYTLKKMYKSPNGTIRAILDGTVFRAPIVVKGIEPCVKNWKKPITIARHAYGDVYKASEMQIPGPGKVELVYTAEDGSKSAVTVHEFKGPGVVQGMHNLNGSIDSFARSCFNYALETHQDLWFATKDTISKIYAIVKPYEKTIKKILPVALAICALKLFNGEKFDEVQEKLEGVLETVETTVCSKFGVSNEIFSKENIKKVLIIAGVLAVVFVAYGKKIKGEETAENAKFTELLKGVAPIIPVVVLVFPQLKKVFSKFMKDTEEGAVDAEVVSSDETEEHFETGSEDKVVENAENAEMKTDSCGNETTSETVTDSSENETATDEN